MTPEERAAEWMGSPYTADEREANARLAALFCAAENDALEAAAQKADGMPRGASFSDEYGDGHDQACDRIAEAIRAMKRETVSSSGSLDMTPAERAERELRGFWRPDSSEAKDGRRLLAIFRDTIRDAENQALELAAARAETSKGYPTAVSERIRALKHSN